MPPNKSAKLWARTVGGASAAALSAACSVLPAPGFPPFEEREVIARYAFDAGIPAAIEVPASRPGFTIAWLSAEPGGNAETFAAGKRLLRPASASLTLRCRYRAYQERGVDGQPRPYPSPSELFPGADEVRTVSRSR